MDNDRPRLGFYSPLSPNAATSRLQAMSGLPPRLLKSYLMYYTNPPMGADIDETSGVKPVFTDGATKVVVVKTSVDPGTRRKFRAVQEGVENTPRIKTIDGNTAWTATGVPSNDPVALKPLNVPADQYQMWMFDNVAQD
ncbi:hypothetical protein OG21DRAFT_1525733 [Imleria badia]|nr:hypothetical protein OG21DRAFT_1525733 [Imleria badia]